MASSERSALLTYRLCGGSGEEERGRERGRATAAAPRKLPTFLGVVVPTLLSMFSVVLFLRLGECRRPAGRPPPPLPGRGPGPPETLQPCLVLILGPSVPPRPPLSGAPVVTPSPPVWNPSVLPLPSRCSPTASQPDVLVLPPRSPSLGP